MGGEALHRAVLRGPVEVGLGEPLRVRRGGVMRHVRYEYKGIVYERAFEGIIPSRRPLVSFRVQHYICTYEHSVTIVMQS